uniref:RIIa domain-containing protein n=2 Tax=Hucho hucho TaxID=62062 RepID=A0A4W5KHW7_9TELE
MTKFALKRDRRVTFLFRMSQTGKPVVIPPELPGILKQFTKDAIRTQPEDLLEWATLYFSALVQGQTLPVNRTPDKVVTPNTMDLTSEVLTTMHKKLHKNGTVSKKEVSKLWRSLGLADDLLRHIMTVGCFGDELDWIKFFALGCSYLGGAPVIVVTSCKPPDACVTFETFHFLYSYLAAVDREVSQAQIDRTITYLEAQAKARDGMVKVSDFVNSRKVRLG